MGFRAPSSSACCTDVSTRLRSVSSGHDAASWALVIWAQSKLVISSHPALRTHASPLNSAPRCLWYTLTHVATSAPNHTIVRGFPTPSPVGTFSVLSASPTIMFAAVIYSSTEQLNAVHYFSCLQRYTPSHCPLCREVCRGEKIKELRVKAEHQQTRPSLCCCVRQKIT